MLELFSLRLDVKLCKYIISSTYGNPLDWEALKNRINYARSHEDYEVLREKVLQLEEIRPEKENIIFDQFLLWLDSQKFSNKKR